MKCNNCNSEIVNDAEFCGNCGFKQQPNPQLQSPKKNKKKIIIIVSILLVVALLITILVLVFNKSGNFKDPFQDVDDLILQENISSTREYEEINSVSNTLEQEFSENKINADKYIMQLAYSIYDTDSLDYKYKNLELGTPNPTELFRTAGELADSLSVDTAKYIVEKYMLSNVEWNVESDSNASGMSNTRNNDYKVMPLVSEESDLSKLDKAVLSSNENFLIYYTTSGSNKITDDAANKIAKTLESIVSAYEKQYGLKFQYNPNLQEGVWGIVTETITFGGVPQATTKAKKVLKNSNIDTKYLDTAMPVFIIDTDAENTNALGYYAPDSSIFNGFTKLIIKVFGESNAQMDSILTTYAFPYFVVSSSLGNFDDTKIVLAHELFHHYQAYICGNGSYGECASSLFTTETNADYAASSVVGVNKTGTVINGHAGMFIADIDSSLDKIGYKDYGDSGLGYGAFVFAHNYASAVSNGYTHLFDSMKTTDTLKYLYDKSGGKYKDILITTAKKSLTLDYSNKLLIGNDDGKVLYPKNYKDIGRTNNTQTININYSSMNYYYINPQDYSAGAQLSFNGNSNNLTLLLFIKENNSYKYLHTHSLNKEFVINIDEFRDYQEVAIGIVNSEISGTLSYSYELNNNGTKNPTVTAKDLDLTNLEDVIDNYSSLTCYQIEEDEEYKTVTQVKLSFNKKDKISDMYFKGTIQMKNYDPDNPAFTIAQKVVSGLLYVMQQNYEEQFKYFKVRTEEGTDKYSVIFKITKNYYDALNNSINLNGEDKYSIVKSIQADGFTCQYE